jgi:hypothetical protein
MKNRIFSIERLQFSECPGDYRRYDGQEVSEEASFQEASKRVPELAGVIADPRFRAVTLYRKEETIRVNACVRYKKRKAR